MLNQTELTNMLCVQHDAVRRNETIETTCTERGNKETNPKVCVSPDMPKETLQHQTQHNNTIITTSIRKNFRNLSDFAVKGKCINEQKQNIQNVTVEFKAGLEQVLARRIAKRENLPDLEISKEFICANESYTPEHKNCTREDKIRKVRALVGFNQCIENIVQELTTRNQNNNSIQKTTDIQTNSKEEITQFPQTSKTLQINRKHKTSFDTSKNQYFNYINNFDEVDANTSVNTTQIKTNNFIIHSNNNTNTLNTSNSITSDIKSEHDSISTENPKTFITNNVQSNTISTNIPQPEDSQHVSAQHTEILLVEPENEFITTLQEKETKNTTKISITESFVSETNQCGKLTVILKEHLVKKKDYSNSTNISAWLRLGKGLLKFTQNMVCLRKILHK